MITEEPLAVACPLWVHALLDLSDEPALFVRRDGEVVVVNPPALQLLRSPDVAAFRSIWPALDIGDATSSCAQPQVLRVELKICEQPRGLRLEVHPVTDATAPGHLIALRDEKGLPAQLLQASQLRALVQVLRSLCHDLRTPLHSMVLQVELLRGEVERLATPHGRADAAHEHLAILSDQLVALARRIDGIQALLAHRVGSVESRFDLCDLTRDALGFARLLGRAVGVEIRAALPTGERAPILGRREQILHALLALIAARLHEMPPDGRLLVELSAGPREAAIAIDGGDAARSRTAPVDHDRDRSAAEVGLATARFVLEAHRGTLSQDGARAVLRLPIARNA